MNNKYSQKDLEDIEFYEYKIDRARKNKKIALIILTIIVAAIVIFASSYESNYYEKNHSDSIGWAILIFGPIFIVVVALIYALINGTFSALQDKYRKSINSIKYNYFSEEVKSELSYCYSEIKRSNTIIIVTIIIFIITGTVIPLLIANNNDILAVSIDFIIYTLFFVVYMIIKSKKKKYKIRIEQLEE